MLLKFKSINKFILNQNELPASIFWLPFFFVAVSRFPLQSFSSKKDFYCNRG